MDKRDRPTPPAELEPELRAFLEALGEEDAETIRTVADYVDALAAWAAASADREPADGPDGAGGPDGANGVDGSDDETATVPDGVPERASVTVTEIDGTEYRYYQWRDGDRVRSKTEKR